jgi:hypothetical protein
MKKNILRIIAVIIVLFLAVAFVAKFGGPNILKLYIETGIGNCQKIPILCMMPQEKITNPEINKEYLSELTYLTFPKIGIYVPKGFSVVQENIKKVYYKKRQRKFAHAAIYLLYEEPDFFVNLFPQLKKVGIRNDYEFFERVMSARITNIKNITDAFFVIIKGVFIPDLGNQEKAKMAQFTVSDKKGFINYNLSKPDNYFDCNVFNQQGDYFKIYIKDVGARLDLNKVLMFISTINKIKEPK